MNSTVKYYNKNSREYFEKTRGTDMSELYEAFLPYLPEHGSILDAGCGSGRDLKFFREHGHDAEGIDASEELCQLAAEYSGCKVTCCRMEDFAPDKKYAGIWCCASLLHLEDGAVIEFFRKCQEWLTDGGILFLSVKTGIPTGEDEKGRWFRNFDEGKIRELLVECPSLHLERVFYTEDKTGRRGWKWMNVLIRKNRVAGGVPEARGKV